MIRNDIVKTRKNEQVRCRLQGRARMFLLLPFLQFGTGVANAQSVDVNLNVIREVGGITTFDRSKFITIHSEPSETEWGNSTRGAANFTVDLRADFMFGRDVYFGRDSGTITYQINYNIAEYLPQPGWAKPVSVENYGTTYRDRYSNTNNAYLHPYEPRNQSGVVVAQMHPFWPDGTLTKHNQVGARWAFSTNNTPAEPFGSATGDYMGRFLNEYFSNGDTNRTGPPSPAFVEVINEPDWDLIQNGTTNPDDIWHFHNTVADQIRSHNTNSLIGGYTTTFPDPDNDDFNEWNTEWKSFIDIAGDKMDFWSLHLYDFPAKGGVERYRKGSNVEATFDLIDYYSTAIVGEARPYVISEYGAQTHDFDNIPWTAERDWLRLKSINSLLLSFMDRPHLMLKTLPFIVLKGEWGRKSETVPYQARLMRQANEPASCTGPWVYTELVKFYELWMGVKGTRIMTSASDPDIQTDAYAEGDKLYLILNNIIDGAVTLDLNITDTYWNTIQSVKQKSLYWDGSAVILAETNHVGGISQVDVGSEGTVILEIQYAADVVLDGQVSESKYYATSYLQPITNGQVNTFQINDVEVGTNGNSVLRVGIARAHALSKQPTVVVNGIGVAVPLDLMGRETDARDQFFGILTIPVDQTLVQSNNSVAITFPDDGGHISSVALRQYSSNVTPPAPPVITNQVVTAESFSPLKTGIHPNNGLDNQGGTSAGKIEFYEGGTNGTDLPVVLTNAPFKIDFQWSGLNLDSVGGENDSIFFTLVASGSHDDFATVSTLQLGNNGWGVDNAFINVGRSFRFEVENIYLSAGTEGSVAFGGFTGGQAIKGSGMVSNNYITGTVNGVGFGFDHLDPANTALAGGDFEPAPHVTFKTLTRKNMTLSAREFDFQFAYFAPAINSGYDVWMQEYALSGTNALDNADPDFDGILNIYEYGLGGDPTNGQFGGILPRFQTVGSNIEVVHVVRTNALDELSYYLELSANLLSNEWNNAGYTITGTNDMGSGFAEVTNEVPVDADQKFIRLIIERL